MRRILAIFLTISAIFLANKAFAQCTENLAKAQDDFEAGNFYGIPSLLNDCLKKGTDQDKLEAYRILTLTYLYIDDLRSAQISFMELLELDPEYKPDTTYIELVHLSKEFITTPIVTWRLRAGMNTSFVTVLQQNGSNNTLLSNDIYRSKVGANVIGAMDIAINKYFSIALEPEFGFNKFSFSNRYFNNITGIQDSKDEAVFTEKSLNAALPVSLKFTYPRNIYSPYIYAGYSPNYNLFTNSDAHFVKKENSSQTFTDNKNLNISVLRRSFSNSIIVGIGLKRRVKYNYVFVDLRFKLGLQDMLNTSAQNTFDSNNDVNTYLFTYLQRDNNFRQNEVNFTVGYAWPSYYPRRKKSLNFKTFMKGIFKPKNKYE